MHLNDNKNIPTEEISLNRSKYSIVKDRKEFSNKGEREEKKQNPTTNRKFSDVCEDEERNSEHFVKNIEEENSS